MEAQGKKRRTQRLIAHRGVMGPGVPFIQKPFTGDALAAWVREMLGACRT